MKKAALLCPCGQPAVKRKADAWCCATCDDIEERLEPGQKGMGKPRQNFVQPQNQNRAEI